VSTLKAGDNASKVVIDAPVEALKALMVEAGVATRRLKQDLGVGAGGANGASGASAAPSPPSPAPRLGKETASPTGGVSGAPAVG
jgi:hypothetical protein